MGGGITQEEQTHRQNKYGPNLINIQVKPILHLIVYEALHPFYIFQLYTTIVWFSQLYWQFTLAVLLMSFVSIGLTVWEIRRVSYTKHNSLYTYIVPNKGTLPNRSTP